MAQQALFVVLNQNFNAEGLLSKLASAKAIFAGKSILDLPPANWTSQWGLVRGPIKRGRSGLRRQQTKLPVTAVCLQRADQLKTTLE